MSKKNRKYMKETANANPKNGKDENMTENNTLQQERTEAEDAKETVEAGNSNQASETSQSSESSEASEPNEASAATEEEKLLTALSEAEAKYNDLYDKYLRQMAEFENYRRRTLKEKSELILSGSANLMTAVLPILDDMGRALEAMNNTDDAASCREGFTLIANKFRTILEQNGLKKIETEGKAFDTDFHDAVALMPATDEMPKGTVIDCVQTGYTLNDKVLRHAKVVVAD